MTKEVHEDNGAKALAGFGEHVVRLTDKDTGEVVCFVGMQGGEEKVYFGKAVSPEQVIAAADLLQKKKMRKHIEKERFDKAQRFADRKFS